MQLINMYSSKERTGVLDLEAGLEAYIIPPCTLVDRLLKTAKKSATLATHMATSIPDTSEDIQLLLVVIHRKVFAHMQQLAIYSNLDECANFLLGENLWSVPCPRCQTGMA